MNNTLGRIVFRAVAFGSGEGIPRRLVELNETQWLPPERMRELQWRKLRGLLVHAQRNVPYYREKFRSAGCDVARFGSQADLAELPVLTKQDVLEAGSRLLDSHPTERFRWDVTSGSTGVPVAFRRSLGANGWHRANGLRMLGWYGIRAGQRQARVWGASIDAGGRRRERVTDFLLNRRRYVPLDLDESSAETTLRRMARQRPEYIYGYPSAVHTLARHLLDSDGGALGSWRPKLVVATAEVLFPDQQRDIARAFQCAVGNEYGASEVTMIACSCPDGSMHVNDESVIVEFEPAGLTIDGKQACGLLLTDLNNGSMPMIRYRIGDLGLPLNGACSCGRTLRRIELIGGREGDVIRTPGGRRIHGSIFGYLGKSVLFAGGVRRFRAIQTALDRIEIQVERGPGFVPENLDDMAREIRLRIGEDVRVEFHEVPRIQPEKSGKLRYFHSALNHDD